MTEYTIPKRGVEFIFYKCLPSVASPNVYQTNPTIAAGDFKVSIDGGALNNLTTLPAVTPAGGKFVKFTLSAAEMTGDNIAVIGSDAAGGEWKDVDFNIQPAARQIADLAYPTTSGRAIDVSAGGEVGIDWANIGSPTTTVNLSGTTVSTAQKVDVDTIKTNPVVNGGTVTFPTGATLASTTNITAGTITTVTNLTNSPTNGDLTATMKASISTAVWDAATATYGSAGSYGLLVETNLDAAVSTRLASASYTAPDNTSITAILADTNELQTDWVNGGRLDLIVDAINAKTTNLPSDPADASDISARFDTIDTNLATVDTVVDSILVDTAEIGVAGAGLTAVPWNASWDAEVQSEVTDALVAYDPPTKAELDSAVAPLALEATLAVVDGVADAIKAKTDSLTFTKAGEVDANIQSVNDVTVSGTGASGDEWGP